MVNSKYKLLTPDDRNPLMNPYKIAVETLIERAAANNPGALVLFTTADYASYEVYGADAIMLSKRLNTELLTGGEYAFSNCSKFPAAALHVAQHIAKEANRDVFHSRTYKNPQQRQRPNARTIQSELITNF